VASSSRRQPRSLASQLLAVGDSGEISAAERAEAAEASFGPVPRALLLPIERIAPNPDNPRKTFDHLDDLAISIAERGILQPLLVRRDPERPGYYITVAGARRLLAARIVQGHEEAASRARVAQLPCVVMDQTERDAFADALAENLARQDLSRAEVMTALTRLHREYGWSARYIARRTGRSVSDVAELLGIAADETVAPLVRDEIITPTTAGQIRRLPVELRPVAIAGVHSGRVKTGADVRRIGRQAAATPPTSAEQQSGKGEPPEPGTRTFLLQASDIGHPQPPIQRDATVKDRSKSGEDSASQLVDIEALAVVALFRIHGAKVPRADLIDALRSDLAMLELR
jgi:ParB family chromosome partitioning protein